MPSKRSKKNNKPKVPSNFSSIIGDFTRDLSQTFPEYKHLWQRWNREEWEKERWNREKWEKGNQEEGDLMTLYQYFGKIMPERFFDILYENEDIFLPTSETDTFFLPDVDFKLLYNCEGITVNTKNAIWKYLQLILFTITSSLKDKSIFGDSMNVFDGIDETELQSKISEAVLGIGDFFKNMKETNSGSSTEGDEKDGSEKKQRDGGDKDGSDNERKEEPEGEKRGEYNMPNPNNIFENLKVLFDGKIGKLAKDLVDEMKDELKEIFGDDMSHSMEGDPKDIFKKMMKDPKKMMDLVQKLSVKMKSKFQTGEVNQEDLMKEATEFMKQFKGMGGAGSDQFKEMFQNMTKGMGKNVKMDVNALSRMEKKMEIRERMKKNIELKKEEIAKAEKAKLESQKNIKMVDGKPIFSLNGGDKQEKSTKEDIEKIMKDMNLKNEVVNVQQPIKKKKGKK
jgi:hypothetical protein